jgi:hypothetical protein
VSSAKGRFYPDNNDATQRKKNLRTQHCDGDGEPATKTELDQSKTFYPVLSISAEPGDAKILSRSPGPEVNAGV